ncbi:MAG: GNAT family N-acetyltransferase [Marinifilaceae bacterium]
MELNLFSDVTLRLLRIEDSIDIFHTINTQREYLSRWLPFVTYTTSVEYTQKFVESVVASRSDSYMPTFTIRKDNEFIGLIGFKDTDTDNCKTEIGYWLSENEQSKGIATCAVKALCQYAFNQHNINRIQIKCAVGNISSSNIPKRLKFIFEGIERAGELFPDGSFKDLEIYSILKTEYNTPFRV